LTDSTLSPDTLKALMKQAHAAYAHAYTPYSHFPVGAALLLEDGSIEPITGCNVENASFGLAICAERVAITKAVSTGNRRFRAIAIAAAKASPCYPCGTCLQFIREFGPDIQVILEGENGVLENYSISEMLPYSFTSDDLNGKEG
jgi:cytidine deaminase